MLALIPVKNISEAKGRLSPILSELEKARLVTLMLDRLLDALEQASCVDNIVVLSKDSCIEKHCRNRGIVTLAMEEDKDLNTALQAAKTYIENTQPSQSIMILPADLPLVKAGDIQSVTEAHIKSQADISICPSQEQRGMGSNCLILEPDTEFTFELGDNSFEKHKAQARQKKLKLNILSNNNIARDIDTPEQLQCLLKDDDLIRSALYAVKPQENIDLSGKIEQLKTAKTFSANDWLTFTENPELQPLLDAAASLRDAHYGKLLTYSRKVFIPLTQLCRNVCHYCTFAQTPKKLEHLYMSLEQVVDTVNQAKALGCKEILFTLGERPELRYPAARRFLEEQGFESTLDYLQYIAEQTLKQTGLLPHINAGCMSLEEMQNFRACSPSMGLMLENISARLCEKDMPHYGSPDKEPQARLDTIEAAGKLKIPFTTGILIGIGETRAERIESLLAINALHEQYGHIQEVIVQNFRAKEKTKMVNAEEPGIEDLQWTIAMARLILNPEISVQAPPNLSPEHQSKLIEAGINDWGGISPLTPDFVNPEAPWPQIENLKATSALSDKLLQERLTVYPQFITPIISEKKAWIEEKLYQQVLRLSDCGGLANTDSWRAGSSTEIPFTLANSGRIPSHGAVSDSIQGIVNKALAGEDLAADELVQLFQGRGADFDFICHAADHLRQNINGDSVSYVINRNINYTNICTYKCAFCAFSKGQAKENLRDTPYRMQISEVVQRVMEAEARGASEVCLQGGIHPEYTGEYYVELCREIKSACPNIHIHAFSPLEIWQGAHSINARLDDYLRELKQAGLASLPGTAAEILDDDIRQIICPDKINTAQWLEVIETAHEVGLPTTSTIMFGHVEGYQHWANHLIRLKRLQERTHGITEFVPLPFVANEAPIYKRGLSRSGPSFREALLMHAVARLYFGKSIPNIQASWVKLGAQGVAECLKAGANDLGGTLMNESITRAAGASHGQEFSAQKLHGIVNSINRHAIRRDTLYRIRPFASEELLLIPEAEIQISAQKS